jgi:hypothetical protein
MLKTSKPKIKKQIEQNHSIPLSQISPNWNPHFLGTFALTEAPYTKKSSSWSELFQASMDSHRMKVVGASRGRIFLSFLFHVTGTTPKFADLRSWIQWGPCWFAEGGKRRKCDVTGSVCRRNDSRFESSFSIQNQNRTWLLLGVQMPEKTLSGCFSSA